MVLIILLLLPMLLVNLVCALISHRRPSWPYALMQGAFSSALCVAISLLVLLPLDRVYLYGEDGMLSVVVSNTQILLCIALPVVLGLLSGLMLREAPLSSPVRARHPLLGALALILYLLLLLLSQAYLWGRYVYTLVTLDEIEFYLRMPLNGVSYDFIRCFLLSVVLPTALAFLPVLILCVLPGRCARQVTLLRRFRLPLLPFRLPLLPVFAVLAVWFGALYSSADTTMDLGAYLNRRFSTSPFIEDHYVSPNDVAIVFPEQKRNLITIYLESCETTPQDKANGGILDMNLIPELTRIARENVSFSQDTRITGALVPVRASWTMGGLVAQTAGLPLLMPSNIGQNYDQFLPGAIALGDILRDEGYRLIFMAGSDFTFGGRRVYFGAHGDYEVFDWPYAIDEGILPEDYYTYWGFEDSKLYAYAKDVLTELAQGDQPFHFSMLTVDTHDPGYRCPLCPTDYINGTDALNYADVLRCSSAQLDAFLSWCQQQSFYENTTIVITGDHGSMQSFFYRNMLNDPHAEEYIQRYVYNAFVNSAVQPVSMQNRQFTTLDFFPSTLASIGVSIAGERLGLGTNLFSDTPTLCEQYGTDWVLAELEKASPFYDRELLYQ